jgi:hypothetical protein
MPIHVHVLTGPQPHVALRGRWRAGVGGAFTRTRRPRRTRRGRQSTKGPHAGIAVSSEGRQKERKNERRARYSPVSHHASTPEEVEHSQGRPVQCSRSTSSRRGAGAPESSSRVPPQDSSEYLLRLLTSRVSDGQSSLIFLGPPSLGSSRWLRREYEIRQRGLRAPFATPCDVRGAPRSSRRRCRVPSHRVVHHAGASQRPVPLPLCPSCSLPSSQDPSPELVSSNSP